MDAKNFLGHTALHDAADAGHAKVVKVLIEKGCNIEAQNDNGSTALHLGPILQTFFHD